MIPIPIPLPPWAMLKENLVAILKHVSDVDSQTDTNRSFLAQRDRWRPWISKQDGNLANVMIDSVETRGGRRYSEAEADINIDMYSLGEYEERDGQLFPADEVAARRLDLLTNQVFVGLTALVNDSFGFEPGMIDTGNLNPTLIMYNQEREETTGQYAPARWSMRVRFPLFPAEVELPRLEELHVALDGIRQRYTFPVEAGS